MSLQSLFMRFHEAIKHDRFDEGKELREKRERILTRLRNNLPATFDWFNQGSYSLDTGIKPINNDYDIDIGIILNGFHWQDYDPVTVKGWIHEAVKNHTRSVKWKRPCITVYYQEAGESIYHVDLAILARDRYDTKKLRLAIGCQHSALNQREWQPDDRQGFISLVDKKQTGEDSVQFRRVIRYLKRWKDENFSDEGHAAPTGLSLTVAAYYSFSPRKSVEYYTGKVTYDDLDATLWVARWILNNFSQVWDLSNNRYTPRIKLKFPCDPYDDVFEKMTNQQMIEFHQTLSQLISDLEQAKASGSPSLLKRAFGKDFPLS